MWDLGHRRLARWARRAPGCVHGCVRRSAARCSAKQTWLRWRVEENRMATTAAGVSRPGVSVGPTSEFSLFFRVKPGEGEGLRTALGDLQDTPGYRPGDYGMAIRTIHE